MDLSFHGALLPAFVGFIGGMMGSIVAPWVHWRIEKRRIKLQNRKDKIARWREMLTQVLNAEKWSDPGDLDRVLCQEADFLGLRPYLSDKTRDMIGDFDVLEAEIFAEMAADISRLEVKWGLL